MFAKKGTDSQFSLTRILFLAVLIICNRCIFRSLLESASFASKLLGCRHKDLHNNSDHAMNIKIKKIFFLLLCSSLLSLSACGGSGGKSGGNGNGGGGNPPANNWDSMNWDTGQWQ